MIAVIAFTYLLTGAFISILLTKALDPAPHAATLDELGPMTCNVSATRGEERLSIVAFDRSERATYYVGTEPHFVGVPDRIVVRVIVHY